MATFSVTGNVGGTAASGASVRLLPANVTSPGSALLATANASGVYTFSGLVPGNYSLSAFLSGFYYKSTIDVVINASNLTDVNLSPTANGS